MKRTMVFLVALMFITLGNRAQAQYDVSKPEEQKLSGHYQQKPSNSYSGFKKAVKETKEKKHDLREAKKKALKERYEAKKKLREEYRAHRKEARQDRQEKRKELYAERKQLQKEKEPYIQKAKTAEHREQQNP